jgi:hypothetical protein
LLLMSDLRGQLESELVVQSRFRDPSDSALPRWQALQPGGQLPAFRAIDAFEALNEDVATPLSWCYRRLAWLYQSMGRYEEAEANIRLTIMILEKLLVQGTFPDEDGNVHDFSRQCSNHNHGAAGVQGGEPSESSAISEHEHNRDASKSMSALAEAYSLLSAILARGISSSK